MYSSVYCILLSFLQNNIKGSFSVTDKELRKLSRLELLELLLEVSNENKKLKEKIITLKAESKTAQNIENLSLVSRQVENTLKYANSLTDSLKTVVKDESKSVSIQETQAKPDLIHDRDIYIQMLRFFVQNDDKLNVFPADIENIVRMRIKSILERKNK